jgi:hypothetical protein
MRQGGRRRVALAAAAWLCWLSPAAAQDPEVSPKTSSGPVLVSAGAEDTIYYALDAGRSLDYLAAGPVELVLQARLRIPDGRAKPSGVVEAFGNGEFRIPDIVVDTSAVTGGVVYDARGGVPSEVVLSTITVPPGGTSLTIKAPSGGPDFLVRVTKRPAAETAVATLEQPPAESTLVEETATNDLVLATTETAMVAPTVDVAEAEPMVATAPATESQGFLRDHEVKAGPELGLGAPARGSAAVFYYGIQGRIAVVPEMIDATLSIGAYRVGVFETYRVDDPYAGPVTVAADYHTTVVPVEVSALYRVPILLAGIVQPFAGAGVSIDFARRTDGAEHVGGVGIGTGIKGGVNIDAGPGQLSANVGWNGVRHDFGNLNADGDPVRETLAFVRVGAAWLYAF